MARATHLTIGTADRIRLDARTEDEESNIENGENEMRQEVQVSVTYALDAGDTDLTTLAEEKAEEVQRAHEAAWHRIGAFRTPPAICTCLRGGEAAEDEKAEDEKAEDENAGDDTDDPGDGPQGDGLPSDPAPIDPPQGGPSRGAWYMPGNSRLGNGTPSPLPSANPNAERVDAKDVDAEPITGPQKILIRSRAGKIGLSAYALESLLYQQFKIWRLERLTKVQAASLLDALNRDLKERDAEGRDPKEKNGVHGSPAPAGTGQLA